MEIKKFQNPFTINRAEHLGENLYQYYAGAKLLADLLSPRSLVLQGGRGSGKTMYFMYHSYDSKKREHLAYEGSNSNILEKETILGIYFKAEPDLVTGFRKKNRDEDWWLSVFGHYLNVTICRRICNIALDLIESNIAVIPDQHSICSTLSRNFGWGIQQGLSFAEAISKLQCAEDETLLYINNIDKQPEPIFSNVSRGMKSLATMVVKSIGIEDLAFHVFIDEFENLEIYQQKLVNSLIKNPSHHLVIDIGVRKEGFKTYNTLAENEQISAENDFRSFDLEEQINSTQYDELIKELCFKRLRTLNEISIESSDKTIQIQNYLGKYNPQEEAEQLVSKNPQMLFLPRIKEQLVKINDQSDREKIYKILTGNANPIINRLNLVLLLQRKDPHLLAEELKKYERGEDSKYKEWLHNHGLAVVFLLCGDYGQRKKYYGYDTFLQLSSGIPRYFIQLCFYASEYAHSEEGFYFGNGTTISISAQDRAAHHFSATKVDEIDTYPPVGHKLKRLTLILGRIFEQLHKRSNIGEPEINHFSTNQDVISDNSREVLESGIMWAVFQVRPLTKIKDAKQPRGLEYHLNHIYAPYFEISYRRKRRIDIDAEDFDLLVNGKDIDAARVAKKLIGSDKLKTLSELLQWEDMQAYQTDFWSIDENQ